jgi:predicted nicotinamide N-methyase
MIRRGICRGSVSVAANAAAGASATGSFSSAPVMPRNNDNAPYDERDDLPESQLHHLKTFLPPTRQCPNAIVSSRKLVIPPPPPPSLSSSPPSPLLLLEGDPYLLSSGGVARSIYRLSKRPAANHDACNRDDTFNIHTSNIQIEEIYDVERNQKSFLIHKTKDTLCEQSTTNATTTHPSFMSPSSSSEIQVTIEELNDSMVRSGSSTTKLDEEEGRGCCQTGNRTWDSSIVMALYFASHPEILRGKDVIELGSGVGLGGILASYMHYGSYRSLTLTDYNPRIIKQLNANIRRQQFTKDAVDAVNLSPSSMTTTTMQQPTSPVCISRLDWQDFRSMTGNVLDFAGRYDIVLACDVAYRYDDLEALTATMTMLLRPLGAKESLEGETNGPSIHIFGPDTRGGLISLIEKLREMDSISVHVESMDLTKGRLDPENRYGHISSALELSQNDYTFFHVKCTRQRSAARYRMEDLD